MDPEAPALITNGLCRTYTEGGRRRRVLDHVDLEVGRGECVALLGRSGSGKSTLLNLISGIDRPDGGEVIVGGRNLTRMNERERTLFRRHHIGFVYQFFNLLPTLTALENLVLPLELTRRDPAAAAALLAEVGLAERADAFPDRLSGGEQQRIALARALVHEPLLVLADEPTGNLDSRTGRRVLELLERMVRGSGKTLVVATHATEVADIADRSLVLADGRLTESPDVGAW